MKERRWEEFLSFANNNLAGDLVPSSRTGEPPTHLSSMTAGVATKLIRLVRERHPTLGFFEGVSKGHEFRKDVRHNSRRIRRPLFRLYYELHPSHRTNRLLADEEIFILAFFRWREILYDDNLTN